MIQSPENIFSFLPAQRQALHAALMPLFVLLCVAGLLCEIIPHPSIEKTLWTVFKLICAVIVVSFIDTFAVSIQNAVNDALSKIPGYNASSPIFAQYWSAVNGPMATQGANQNPHRLGESGVF